MAPRGSGGYSSGGYSLCAGLFTGYYSQVNLGYYLVFIIIFIGISIALCCVRKRSGEGRKLIGPIYMVALFSMIVSLILNFISFILNQCGNITEQDNNGLYMSSIIVFYLSIWGLLYVVFYKLNNMLRKQLGAVGMIYKAVPLVLLGILLALFIVQIVLDSYLQVDYFANPTWNHSENLYIPMVRLVLANRVIYLLLVLASTALTVMTISALRTRRLPGGDLFGWVAVLYFFMLVWTVVSVVLGAMNFTSQYAGAETIFALTYVVACFQALSFVVLLGIAKHVCWSENRTFTQQVYAPVMQQQTAYGYGSGQSDYYQQPPALAHAK